MAITYAISKILFFLGAGNIGDNAQKRSVVYRVLPI